LVEDGHEPGVRESLSCAWAERALSRQLDGELSRRDRRRLRAHLSWCGECGTFARGQRAQRAAVRALAAVPLPASLKTCAPGSASFAPAGRLSG
jgi:anti-sigma factor RsiW